MIEVSVYLFGKPSWEMEIEGKDKIDPQILRDEGDELKERLYRAAEIVEALQNSGWQIRRLYLAEQLQVRPLCAGQHPAFDSDP